MPIQWLTFAVTILIQTAVAVWTISAIRTTLDVHEQEIKTLRDWKHTAVNKLMSVDQHERDLIDHEMRLRDLEK